MGSNLQETFTFFADSNNPEIVPAERLEHVLRVLGYTLQDKNFIAEGRVSSFTLQEIQEMIEQGKCTKSFTEEEVIKAFEMLDKNKTGKINVSTIRQVLEGGDDPFTPAEIDAFMEIFPPNPEGFIEYAKMNEAIYRKK